MKRVFAVSVVCSVLGIGALGQTGGKSFPPEALQAKTVAIVNDTHSDDVEKGAETALKAWGRYQLTDNAEDADLTLRFDKTTDHNGASSEKTGDDGKPSYSYGMSFGSSIHMKAYTKSGFAPFYTTKTGDSKRKAGVSCVDNFREAYRAAQAR